MEKDDNHQHAHNCVVSRRKTKINNSDVLVGFVSPTKKTFEECLTTAEEGVFEIYRVPISFFQKYEKIIKVCVE